jgi:hypothetical protein
MCRSREAWRRARADGGGGGGDGVARIERGKSRRHHPRCYYHTWQAVVADSSWIQSRPAGRYKPRAMDGRAAIQDGGGIDL